MHVVILGAGISGLATAWFIKKHCGSKAKITLIEKSSRIGGWIQTVQVGDFLFEQGPRSCRTKGSGREMLTLIEELGIGDQLIGAHPASRRRFIYRKGCLQELPQNPLGILFKPAMQGWAGALWRDWTASKSKEEDESVEAFFNRRLGKNWCSRLADPFMSGIYAGDIRKLSMRSCLPLLWSWEREYGSLLKGAWKQPKKKTASTAFVRKWERESLFSFKRGMQALTEALGSHLNDEINLSLEPISIDCRREGVIIRLAGGKELMADHLISTLPAPTFAALAAPFNDILSQGLNALPYATVNVVNLGYRQSVLKKEGFGYLIPSEEKDSILGCVWDSSVFPQQNFRREETRLTVMIGGTRNSAEQSIDKNGLEIALEALGRHLGISAIPDAVQIKLAKHAIPQYTVGHWAWCEMIQKQLSNLPRLTLAGSAFNGVSVNDCVAHSALSALQVRPYFDR
ncbi:MAG: protoporphyrinogen oxidase [Candidatus Protochlamydia sp.]|nr:protoporphyrinogen oxidase [Candidatus Protochlamydia sp.]